jgi:phage terminase large subunit-like protein
MGELRYRKIALYAPHPKQIDFHTMGAEKRSRLLMAGNQEGKTHAGGYEFACHVTGLYPDWWKGYRFTRPIRAWCSGVNGAKVRDNPQLKIMGARSAFGTGFIPGNMLKVEPAMSKGTTGLIDFIEVEHARGGRSTVKFMTYDMDDAAWESDTLHLIWYDEEPPRKKHSAGAARLTTTAGIDYMTFTPLLGMSEVVRDYYPHPSTPDRGFIRMGIADALHIPAEEHERIAMRYPKHERKARLEGFPILGSGAIYDVPEHVIMVDPFKVPSHWPQIVGLDIGGGEHPTAFVVLAWDRDTDTIYVVDSYKVPDPKISTHAASLRMKGAWRPVAYPHDAHQHDRSSGDTYRDIYSGYGINMLTIHSQFEDGGMSVEPGIAKIEDRLSTGRLKVFSHLSGWFEEYRLYHRKDGLIVKEFDDLLDATRYGIMMIRFSSREPQQFNMPDTVGMDYDPLST